MYGKHFSSMYAGSMLGSGACVFAVWGYVIANTVDSRVELNPRLLAAVIGEPEEKIREAIGKLEAPDPESRSKVCEGRRLVREGQFQFYVPTWESYRLIRQEEERREYNRLKKREERTQKRSMTVNDKFDSQQMSAMSANTEAEADTEAEIQRMSTSACPEPKTKPEPEPPVLEFPVTANDGKPWPLTRDHFRELGETFDSLNVLAECKKAIGWLNADKARRKTPRGMPRFLHSWMSRANDRGNGRGGYAAPAGKNRDDDMLNQAFGGK